MNLITKLFLGLMLLFPANLLAQEPVVPIQAQTLPISNNSYRLQITTPDGNVIRMTLHEGQMGTITFNSENSQLGFTPISSRSIPDVIEIHAFIITTRTDGNQTIRQNDTMILSGNQNSLIMHENRPVLFQLVASTSASQNLATSTSLQGSVSPNIAPSNCCVTCGYVTACGCEVVMDCGRCCARPCC
jgi:hypothetical protein